MELKRCESCPASQEYWKWRLSWTGDTKCIMEECRQSNQKTCAYCPIHMQLRSEYREKVNYGKRPKMVRCVEDDLVFVSQMQAAKYYGIAQGNLAMVVDKPNRSIKGMHFVTWSCFKCAELHKGDNVEGS